MAEQAYFVHIYDAKNIYYIGEHALVLQIFPLHQEFIHPLAQPSSSGKHAPSQHASDQPSSSRNMRVLNVHQHIPKISLGL